MMLFNLIVGSREVHYFGRLGGKTKYFAEIMEIGPAKQEIMEIGPAKQELIIMHFHLFASIYIYPYQIPFNTGMYFAHKVVIIYKIMVTSPTLQGWLI